MKNQDIEQFLRTELRTALPNMVWFGDDGSYELFGRYKIQPESQGFKVHCSATEVGVFGSTRSAVSWCVADKYRDFNLARNILYTDQRLRSVSNDIFVRVGVSNRSKRAEFKESIDIKLENKIIKKKELEQQLDKLINLAKYYQQRGFDNEIARSGRATKNQTNR